MRPNPQDVDLVIYHANCRDGFGAAWAAWKLLGDQAQYLPASYGDLQPDVTGKNVAILDFSYSCAQTKIMIDQANSLVVLDHHRSAQKKLQGIHEAHFDMEQSGAMLSWRFFHGFQEPPAFLRYIEDRDLWKWEMEDSKAVSAAIACVDMTFEEYDRMSLPTKINDLINDGYAILAYNKTVIRSAIERVRRSTWNSYEICVVNSSVLQSEIGSHLAPTCDFAIVWYYDHSLMKYRVSLRTEKENVDVSKIAERFGGGGHKKAAGFLLNSSSSVEGVFWPQ